MHNTSTVRKRVVPLIFLGLLASLFLSHHHIEVKSNLQVGTSICSIDEVFDCDSVAKSVYSEIFGLPVAFLGVFFYSSILLLLLFTRDAEIAVRKLVNSLLYLAFGLALIFSLYLGYQSYFDLGKVCLFCSLLYLLNIALFGLVFYFKEERGEVLSSISYFFRDFLPSMPGLFFCLGNIGLVFLFFNLPSAYESYYLRPRFLAVYDKKVISALIEQWESTSNTNINQDIASKLPGAIIHEPKSSSSEVITIVEYADYECPFCQKLAPVLEKLYNDYSERVRLVQLQFPLDKSCNRSINGNFHQTSCKIARGVLCAGLDYGLSSKEVQARVLKDKIDTKESMEQLLAEFGIDETKCVKADQALKEQIEFAIDSNIHSTPSVFVSGKLIRFNSFPQIDGVLREIVGKSTPSL